jgi:acyl-coenzyme A thioesterase 13
MSGIMQPPAGFAAADVHSPFLDTIGPLWSREVDGRTDYALIIDERHLNTRGGGHGGVLAALADVALARTVSRAHDPPARVATASLSIDYAGAVELGETVIATVDVQRIGRRLAFANCDLHCGERRVVHASAVIAVLE